MYQALETVQNTAKENIDLIIKNIGNTSKGVQAISNETTDYIKKAFEHNSAAFEQFSSVKSVEKALELQASHAKSAYEGFIAYATKIGSLYTDLAKESVKPLESSFSKIGK